MSDSTLPSSHIQDTMDSQQFEDQPPSLSQLVSSSSSHPKSRNKSSLIDRSSSSDESDSDSDNENQKSRLDDSHNARHNTEPLSVDHHIDNIEDAPMVLHQTKDIDIKSLDTSIWTTTTPISNLNANNKSNSTGGPSNTDWTRFQQTSIAKKELSNKKQEFEENEQLKKEEQLKKISMQEKERLDEEKRIQNEKHQKENEEKEKEIEKKREEDRLRRTKETETSIEWNQ